MSKPIIIAAVSALFFAAAPAFAQDAGCPAPGFNGPHGSATNFRDTPSSDPTEAAPGRHPGFEGPHGSASNLRDRPSSDPTNGATATPSRGLTKAGAGTLTFAREPAARMQSSNNLKQMGIAITCR